MPVLRQRLGQLHADAVHLQVVAVGVGGEQLVGEVRDRASHRHELERQDIDLSGFVARSRDRMKSAMHRNRPRCWRGNVNRNRSGASGLGPGEHDDVVALRHRREVPVHHRGVSEDAVGRQPVQPVPQARSAFGLDEVLVRRSFTAANTAQSPLPQKQCAFVEKKEQQAGVSASATLLIHDLTRLLNQIRRFFTDQRGHASRMGIAGYNTRHYRGIHNPQASDTPHSQTRIYHRLIVAAHFARPDRMKQRRGILA